MQRRTVQALPAALGLSAPGSRGGLDFYLGASGEVAQASSRFQFRAVDLMTAMTLIAVVGYSTEKMIVDTLEKRTLEKWAVKPT